MQSEYVEYTVNGADFARSIVSLRLYDFLNQLGMLVIAHHVNIYYQQT